MRSVAFFFVLFIVVLPVLRACGTCSARRDAGDLTDFAPKLLEEPLAARRGETRIARYGSYTVSYHLGWRQPQWVAYRLDSARLRNVAERKGVSFQLDPLLGEYTLNGQDFKRTGYSRGHLKPAADSKSSVRAMQESFYYSNTSPQTMEFNSGIWNSLEIWVRRCAERSDMLYVVTGPCFADAPLAYMGSRRVPVAPYFFKALLRRSGGTWSAVGFFVPHDLNRRARVMEFAISIDSLERCTAIDFFPLLDDAIEREIEARFDLESWKQ